MKRNKFFISLGTGAFGLLLLNKFPLNLFSKNNAKRHVEIKINPDAVSRKKIGDKNV
jgi:hypothetical protein